MKEAMQRAMVTYFVTILGRETVEAVLRAMEYNSIVGKVVLTNNGWKDAVVGAMGHKGSMCECYRGNPIWETSDSCADKAWEAIESAGKADPFDHLCRWVNEENLPVFRDILSASH